MGGGNRDTVTGFEGPPVGGGRGPYGAPHVGIQVRYESGSRNDRRKADNSAMREISVERVCYECDLVLDASLRTVA